MTPASNATAAPGAAARARSAGRILVDQLLVHGVTRAFCVPGESYLPVLDALHDVPDRIALTVCRQEGGAANMAEAWGKLGDGPGICFVTRGPGATNAAIGLHTARQDSTPMILFVGQVGSDFVEREAFQEVDYRRMFGSMVKWVASIDRADRIPEMVSHAFHAATSGRCGPVVLALPEDMLAEEATVPDGRRYAPAQAAPSPEAMRSFAALLESASRPLLLIGGSAWSDEGRAALTRFAHRHDLPVACAWRFQDAFDNCDSHYVGEIGIGVNPRLGERLRDADLVVAVGARLGEMTTSGYSLLEVPLPRQQLIHVYPDPDELGRVYTPTLSIVSSGDAWARALDSLAPDSASAGPAAGRPDAAARRQWLEQAQADYARWREPRQQPGELDYPAAILHLDRTLPPDAIIANGAGNFASPLHRFYRHRQHKTQLSPSSGAMGYGVPAAIAAALRHPGRTVLAVTGDGDFLMTGQELATARQYGAAITVLLVNNGMYGTIRMHQERHFPGRVHGTDLANPEFDALARAYGCFGERVTRTGEFPAALERALQANRSGIPALLELVVDPQAITANQTLDEIRRAARGEK
ncbi:MAG: thiamine pyrophosphate-binding protein [Burkholderiaceae bacterium]|nr:thiamine pyrophosphate-binding protein [Burkholderiaceae bacterium]